jgi:dTMP kinase
MNPAQPRGLLVVVEGIDGAGKSTAAKHLAAWCRGRGMDVVSSREPTDGTWGRQLRQSAQDGRLSLEQELELFLKDRAEHVEGLVRPALGEGKVVILDRYYFSTAAYQGARGADPAEVIAQNERFAPMPDIVLLLDSDPTRCLGRVRGRGDEPNAFERADALMEVRRIFLSLRRPEIVRIDACQPAATVARYCEAALSAALERRRNGADSLAPHA